MDGSEIAHLTLPDFFKSNLFGLLGHPVAGPFFPTDFEHRVDPYTDHRHPNPKTETCAGVPGVVHANSTPEGVAGVVTGPTTLVAPGSLKATHEAQQKHPSAPAARKGYRNI